MLRVVLIASMAAACAPADAQSGATRFKRDPARLEAMQAKLVDQMRQTAPEAASDVEKLFGQNLIATLAPQMAQLGLDTNDMADMTTVYWVTAWEASNGIVGRQTDPALVKGARDQIAKTMASAAQMTDAQKQGVADMMLLQGLLAEARMGAAAKAGVATQQRMSDTIHAEAGRILKTDLRQVALTPAGFAPKGGASSGPAPHTGSGSISGARTGAFAANWSKVEGVYFKSYTSFGVGGMMTQDYEPVVLFNDGSYYEVEGPALEDIDLAAARQAKPRDWGRWTRSGDSFTFTTDRGKTSTTKLQGGSFFKAFGGDATGGKLSATYSRVSGGGNSAMGGELTIGGQTDLTFNPDGTFGRKSGGGAIGSGSQSGVGMGVSGRSGSVGRYAIDRYTITLTGADGRPKRQFFAFGSKGNPAQVATNMLFLGDRVFVTLRR